MDTYHAAFWSSDPSYYSSSNENPYKYLFHLFHKVTQHPMLLCEKVNGCATFSCNDCKQTLPVAVDQSLTLLRRYFGPLFHVVLI